MPSATLFFFGGCSSLLIGFNDAAASVVNQCFSQSMPQHLPRLDSSQLVNRTPLVLRKPKIRSRHFGRVKGTDKGRKLDRLGRQGWMVTTIEYGCEQTVVATTPYSLLYISYYRYSVMRRRQVKEYSQPPPNCPSPLATYMKRMASDY